MLSFCKRHKKKAVKKNALAEWQPTVLNIEFVSLEFLSNVFITRIAKYARKVRDIDMLMEWTVWAHLTSIRDLDLILLKGHLFLEQVLDSVLTKHNVKDIKNFSFHRKISSLQKIETKHKEKLDIIIPLLFEINRLRNKVAHEPLFNVHNGEIEFWASNILKNFEGEKFTKYTRRTKIVHAFSIITKNIFEYSEPI